MAASFATLKNLLNWVSVADYGAVGDDSTDNTTAFQNAINALATTGGTLFIPDGIYKFTSASTTVNGSNSQLHFPDVTSGCIGITLTGSRQQSMLPSVTGSIVVPTAGAILHSSATSGAVFGGKSASGTYDNFTLVNTVFENLTIRTQNNPGLTGLDLSFIGNVRLTNVVVDTGVYNIAAITQPSTTTAYGVKMPGINNGAYSRIESLMVIGYYTGILFGEHTDADNLGTWGCYYAGEISNQNHGSHVRRWLDVHSRNGLRCTASSTPHPRLSMSQFAIEYIDPSSGSPTWQRRQADIVDGSNLLFGTCQYASVLAGTGPSSTFVKTGGTNFTATDIGE